MKRTTKEAAEIIERTPGRIRQMILSGQLKAEKHGRDWLIEDEDLEAVKDLPRGRPRKPLA